MEKCNEVMNPAGGTNIVGSRDSKFSISSAVPVSLLDFQDPFVPIARLSSIRMLSFSPLPKAEPRQMDVKSAYLNSPIDTAVCTPWLREGGSW